MKLPSLATAWNYHHYQLHGTTITGSCIELPSLVAALEYTARNPNDWPNLGIIISGRNTNNDSCIGKQLLAAVLLGNTE
jgi:hypothetical protein